MKRLISVVLVALFLASGLAFAEQKGKICVAADGKGSEAAVSEQAGRADFFLIFDKKGNLIETLANPEKNAASRGTAVVHFLVGKGVTTVVAEGFGPKIVGTMESKGIKAISFKGSVEEAIKNVLQSKNGYRK